MYGDDGFEIERWDDGSPVPSSPTAAWRSSIAARLTGEATVAHNLSEQLGDRTWDELSRDLARAADVVMGGRHVDP